MATPRPNMVSGMPAQGHKYLRAHLDGGNLWKVTTILYDSKADNIFIQFSSVAQLYLTLCNPMNCSRPGLPVHYQLLESTQTHDHQVGDGIQPSHPLSSPSPPALTFPASWSFQMSQLYASGGQSIGVSASKSVLPMNTQD